MIYPNMGQDNSMNDGYVANQNIGQIPVTGALCSASIVNNTSCVEPQTVYQPGPNQFVNMNQLVRSLLQPLPSKHNRYN